jgi:hypothetical protein
VLQERSCSTPSVKATMHVSLCLGATSRIRALLSILMEGTSQKWNLQKKNCIRGKRPVCSILSVPRWTDEGGGLRKSSIFQDSHMRCITNRSNIRLFAADQMPIWMAHSLLGDGLCYAGGFRLARLVGSCYNAKSWSMSGYTPASGMTLLGLPLTFTAYIVREKLCCGDGETNALFRCWA